MFSYSKVEGLLPSPSAAAAAAANEATPSPALQDFTFLLISAGEFPLFKDTHRVVKKVEGFSHLILEHWRLPPVKMALREKILILVRNIDASTCVLS